MSTWLEIEHHPVESHLSGLDPIIADRIMRLGLKTEQQVIAFLDPSRYEPSHPSELPGLIEVADRVEFAIRNQEPICVWGDFDVDGQTSTAILVSTLKDLGACVTFHIPVRGPESHGLSIPHLRKEIDKGSKLILTCDTGITAHEAIEFANSQAVDVVITDHHDLPPKLPPAIALTNPKFLKPDHPLSTLAGAGVAFKLAEELYARFGQINIVEKHLDLAALGLVADLAGLQGDTRYLVQRGLEALRSTERLGLQVLMEIADLIPDHLSEEHIGFVIGPRLNALGRLADANIAVEFLTTTDPSRARVIATILEGLNAQRQLLTNQVYKAAESQIDKDPSILKGPILILSHPTWPAGIIGIAASRLVERYHRPVILISNPPDEPARGSARSIEGINLTAAIQEHEDLLLGFGGHPMAAGLSMESNNIPEFIKGMTKTIRAILPEQSLEHVIQIDGIFSLEELNLEMADTIEQLAPFGSGNPKPVMVSNQLKIINSSRIGRQQDHLKLLVEDKMGTQQTVLWWNAGDVEPPDGLFDLAYNLRASDWKGSRQIQLEFVDIRSSLEEQTLHEASVVEILDMRNEKNTDTIIKNLPPKTLIWIEGEERLSLQPDLMKKNPGIKFADRNKLSPATCFAIWTPPASQKELKLALERVKPKHVILLDLSMINSSPETFIGQLMGLIKFILNHREGKVTYPELAAATAQREITVRSALSWLIFQGEISLSDEKGNEITLIKGSAIKDPIQAARYWVDVKNLLAETSAYRRHFLRADKDSLISG